MAHFHLLLMPLLRLLAFHLHSFHARDEKKNASAFFLSLSRAHIQIRNWQGLFSPHPTRREEARWEKPIIVFLCELEFHYPHLCATRRKKAEKLFFYFYFQKKIHKVKWSNENESKRSKMMTFCGSLFIFIAKILLYSYIEPQHEGKKISPFKVVIVEKNGKVLKFNIITQKLHN